MQEVTYCQEKINLKTGFLKKNPKLTTKHIPFSYVHISKEFESFSYSFVTIDISAKRMSLFLSQAIGDREVFILIKTFVEVP